jgi:hypothetical protein
MSDDKRSWLVSDLSTEFVKVRVDANVDGDPLYNPTGDSVAFAFVARDAEPTSGDFVQGSWETQSNVTPNNTTYIYKARCLVGPAGGFITLAQGNYDVYVKITDNPEVPVKFVGILEVSR